MARQRVPLIQKPIQVEPPKYPLAAPDKSFRTPGTMVSISRSPDYTRMEKPGGSVVRDYAKAPDGDYFRGSGQRAPLRGQVNDYKPIARASKSFKLD